MKICPFELTGPSLPPNVGHDVPLCGQGEDDNILAERKVLTKEDIRNA